MKVPRAETTGAFGALCTVRRDRFGSIHIVRTNDTALCGADLTGASAAMAQHVYPQYTCSRCWTTHAREMMKGRSR